jgi:asparagine synthase (glutamine-hydrolysing)
MSRIVGILARDAAEWLGPMIVAVQQGRAADGPVIRLSSAPAAGLAAVGPRAQRSGAQVGSISVALDGAIYNRHELGACASDAELVAQLYREHGFADLLPRLNGDFAIALYDSESRTLWLARDRLGVKPLYYAQDGSMFAFASRPAPLLQLPGVGTSINRRFVALFAAGHYRYFDNAPQESPYERVRQLPAGSWLCVRDGAARIGQYWSLSEAAELEDPREALAERYRELLLSAVRMRLQTCERPAFTLSGGMDSSSVLASARHVSGVPHTAFSAVYSDRTYDESDEIRPMLDHAVSRWHTVRVDNPDVFGLVARMVAVNDEPVATATWLSHFLLCEQVSLGGFDALFGGLGGDELNAGEYEYFFFHFADLARLGRTAELEAEIRNWAAHHDHPIYRKNRDVAFATMARCIDPSRPGHCKPDPVRLRRYFGTLQRDFYDVERFEPVMEVPFASYLKTRCYQDLTRETAPCCLRAEDRHTQAFGLENHVPFFDHRLVEFMFRVSGSLKIGDGVTKVLLRQAMRGILPEETRTRIKKTGWNAPAHIWFSGAGRAQLDDLIHSREFVERGIYDVAEVRRLVEEHEQIVRSGAQRENHMMFLWQLVNLELWLRSLAA